MKLDIFKFIIYFNLPFEVNRHSWEKNKPILWYKNLMKLFLFFYQCSQNYSDMGMAVSGNKVIGNSFPGKSIRMNYILFDTKLDLGLSIQKIFSNLLMSPV